MKKMEWIANLADPDDVADTYGRIGEIGEKRVRITVVEYRERRSDAQNRYYHPCFVAPLAKWLREQNILINGHLAEHDDAHDMLKLIFLSTPIVDVNGEPVVNPVDGQPMRSIGSTANLSKAEFNNYLDRCGAWLWTSCGIPVPPPSVTHNATAEREAA